MKRYTLVAGAAALGILVAASAFGQGGHGQHGRHGGQGAHGGHASTTATDTPSTAALKSINARMHADMDIAYSGNADIDFARAMIPHHQGAIDMAKVVLAFGKDPEVRKLAEAIIRAQDSEIAWMQDWLKKNAPSQ